MYRIPLLLVGFLLAMPAPMPAQDAMLGKYSANAMATEITPPTTTFVYITIDRWTTDTERQQLAEVLAHEGSFKLANTLFEQQPTGTLKIQGKNPYTLRYARKFEQDGKTRIILATDRAISFQEMKWSATTGSSTYNLAIIVLDVDEKGKGNGTLSAATKIRYNEGTQSIELESYTYDPIKLLNVKRAKD